jgi:hypothetical protein
LLQLYNENLQIVKVWIDSWTLKLHYRIQVVWISLLFFYLILIFLRDPKRDKIIVSWETIKGWHWQVTMYSLRGRKKKKKDTRKKFLNSAYINVGRRSLGICSQAFCWVFVCVVIHIAERCTGLVLRSGAIHSVGTI